MIGYNQHQLRIKATGRSCTVPDHPIARLMYYLHSVDSLVDFGIPSHLKEYENYGRTTFDQENTILCFAALLNPKIFIENKIMIHEPSLCGNSSNKFFEISDTTTSVAATREFVIGGRRVRTLNIMAFEISWLENNYIKPMKYYSRRLQAIENGTVDEMRPRSRSNSQSCTIC